MRRWQIYTPGDIATWILIVWFFFTVPIWKNDLSTFLAQKCISCRFRSSPFYISWSPTLNVRKNPRFWKRGSMSIRVSISHIRWTRIIRRKKWSNSIWVRNCWARKSERGVWRTSQDVWRRVSNFEFFLHRINEMIIVIMNLKICLLYSFIILGVNISFTYGLTNLGQRNKKTEK